MRLCSIGLLNGRRYCWLLPKSGWRSRHEITFQLCCGEFASCRGANCRMESKMARVTMVGVMYKEVVEVEIEVL